MEYKYTLWEIMKCSGWDCKSPPLIIVIIFGFFATLFLVMKWLIFLFEVIEAINENRKERFQQEIDRRIRIHDYNKSITKKNRKTKPKRS